MVEEAELLAAQMWSTARSAEQCARRVPDDALALAVRERIRRLAAEDGIRIRAARPGDAVVVDRLDSRVRMEDAATMRRTLAAE